MHYINHYKKFFLKDCTIVQFVCFVLYANPFKTAHEDVFLFETLMMAWLIATVYRQSDAISHVHKIACKLIAIFGSLRNHNMGFLWWNHLKRFLARIEDWICKFGRKIGLNWGEPRDWGIEMRFLARIEDWIDKFGPMIGLNWGQI